MYFNAKTNCDLGQDADLIINCSDYVPRYVCMYV